MQRSREDIKIDYFIEVYQRAGVQFSELQILADTVIQWFEEHKGLREMYVMNLFSFYTEPTEPLMTRFKRLTKRKKTNS